MEVFKYLGRLLAYNDNNSQAMRANLAKARKSWGQVSYVLRAENALSKVCDMFYIQELYRQCYCLGVNCGSCLP